MADFINTIDALGDETVFDSIIKRDITEYADDKVRVLKARIFHGCTKLQKVDLPSVTHHTGHCFSGCTSLTNVNLPELIDYVYGTYAQGLFHGCTALETLSLPKLKNANVYFFFNCSKLRSLYLPVAETFSVSAAENCESLAIVDLPSVTQIGNRAFFGCDKLKALVLRKTDTVCALGSTNPFHSTPIASGTGYVYVPSSLVAFYRSDTNWSDYANQFRAIEDWSLDGTVNGELGHRVRFFNEDGTLLKSVVVRTGENAVYDGATPTKEGEYEFTGWSANTTNVTEDVDCYAKFRFTGVISRKIVERTISGAYTNDIAKSVGDYAFYYCTALTSINFPVATSIGEYAFGYCSSLTSINFPVATSVGNSAFSYCYTLTSVNLPAAMSLGTYAFANCKVLTSINLPAATSIESFAFTCCYALTSVNLPVATSIGNNALTSCSSLTSVILRSTTVCSLSHTNAFGSCYHILGTTNSTYNPNGDKDGYIYVPRDLVESYKAATNWSTYADQFRAIEDYTVDGTITGELDVTKI